MVMRTPTGKKTLRWILLAGFAALPAAPLAAQAEGETVFNTVCVACHSVGPDRLVGPGLAGVLDRREMSWLLAKITGPDRLLASGDTISTRLATEHGMAMPNLGVSNDQAEAVLAYLYTAAPAGGAAGPADVAAAPPAPIAPPAEADVLLGRALFEGTTRLEGRGPSCVSCHTIPGAGIDWGGSIAVDLSGSFARLGAPVIQAILSNPPFPNMRGAYEGRPPTPPEIAALTALMSVAASDAAVTAPPRNVSARVFGTAFVGALLFIGLASLVWRGRRTGPVYREVFDRQIRSQ